jgi:hypothetical protein
VTVALPPEVLRGLHNGDSAATAAALMALSVKERQALLPAFKARLRDGVGWNETGPMLVAGAAILPTAAQVAAWFDRAQLNRPGGSYDPILGVLIERCVPWLGELGTRLARDIRPDGRGHFPLAARLIAAEGAPVPTGDGFVREWTRHTFRDRYELLLDDLRSDPMLPLLLPRVFEVDGLGPMFSRWDWKERGFASPSEEIFAALMALSAEGVMARSLLLDGTLGRLLRGDSPSALRPFVELHQQLRPTLDELAAHQIDYLRLLPDSRSFVATMAQTALRTLDEAGRLGPDALAEACDAVFGRTEKALVREQMAWLRAIVKRDASRTAEVVSLLAPACGHPDLSLAERAQSLVDSLGGTRPPSSRPSAAGAAVAFVAPARADAPPPIGSPAELAADLMALMDSVANPDTAYDRVLDGIVRMWAASPAEVAAALSPIVARLPEAVHDPDRLGFFAFPHLQHAVTRLVDPKPRPINPIVLRAGSVKRILAARVNELSVELLRSPVPFLLAAPTRATGHLDAAVLVDRMVSLEARGLRPWLYDLDQALLRVPREVDPDAVARSRSLRSRAGQRVASWLTSTMDDPPTWRAIAKQFFDSWERPGHPDLELVEIGPTTTDNALLQAACDCRPYRGRFEYFADAWQVPTLLPSHRELVAAHMLPALAHAAVLDRSYGQSLVFLADCTGPSGPAVALALAYGLSIKKVEIRASTVDALLHMSSRGDLDAAPLGQEIATLAGSLKLNRITSSLDEVARAGHAEAVWRIASAALPAILSAPAPVHGAADLLQLAARAAVETGARGPVEGLDDLLARGGSSQLVTEARRLHRVLAGGAL